MSDSAVHSDAVVPPSERSTPAPAVDTVAADSHSAAAAPAATAAEESTGTSTADRPSVQPSSSPTGIFSSPLHLIPPQDVAQMLAHQHEAITSLRASNHSLQAFQDYATRAFDQVSWLHAQRVTKISRMRDNLTDIFLRLRRVRMQLHARTPGLGPYVEDEAAEEAEIEQLKATLEAEEAAARLAVGQQRPQDASFIDANTSLPFVPSVPNSMPASPDATIDSSDANDSTIVISDPALGTPRIMSHSNSSTLAVSPMPSTSVVASAAASVVSSPAISATSKPGEHR